MDFVDIENSCRIYRSCHGDILGHHIPELVGYCCEVFKCGFIIFQLVENADECMLLDSEALYVLENDGRFPTFWLDNVCIDQECIADGLKVLPVNVMTCLRWCVYKPRCDCLQGFPICHSMGGGIA